MSSHKKSSVIKDYILCGHKLINKTTGKIKLLDILPLCKDYKVIGKSLFKNRSIKKKFVDYQKCNNGWHGLYLWGCNETDVETKSGPGECGTHLVCHNKDAMFFHTHPSHYNPDRKYLPPDCKDVMNTFMESFTKQIPSYSLLIDGSGFYFYRPSDGLWKQVGEMIEKKSGWGFELFESWYENTKTPNSIDDKQAEWHESVIRNLDVEDQLKKKNFKTANECLQHYYGEIGFDIYFIAHNDDKMCFDIINEKIVNLVD